MLGESGRITVNGRDVFNTTDYEHIDVNESGDVLLQRGARFGNWFFGAAARVVGDAVLYVATAPAVGFAQHSLEGRYSVAFSYSPEPPNSPNRPFFVAADGNLAVFGSVAPGDIVSFSVSGLIKGSSTNVHENGVLVQAMIAETITTPGPFTRALHVSGVPLEERFIGQTVAGSLQFGFSISRHGSTEPSYVSSSLFSIPEPSGMALVVGGLAIFWLRCLSHRLRRRMMAPTAATRLNNSP